jgi:DNA-binding NarL/FixJ family response regulator
MSNPAPDSRDPVARESDGGITAWVVSPHLLVAQAVTAALRAAGVDVELRAWETLVEDVTAERDSGATRHVIALFDGLDSEEAVAEIGRLVSLGGVRVVVVTSTPGAVGWGGALEHPAVEVVTMATSITQLADVVERFASGEPLMEPEARADLRAAWSQAVDRRQRLVTMLGTLSPQQLRVLELLASGRRVWEVAELLRVTDGTVRSHVKTLRAKLGAKSQLEAVAMLRQVYEVGQDADIVPRPRMELADDSGVASRR